MVGVITIVGSLYMVYRAVKEMRAENIADSGKPPRHASGGEASLRDTVMLVFGCLLSVVVGALFIRWGILRGLLSLVGMGIAVLRRLVRGQQ